MINLTAAKEDIEPKPLSHKEQFFLTNKLVRELINTYAEYPVNQSCKEDLTTFVVFSTALGCLAKRNIYPTWLSESWVFELFKNLSQGQSIACDQTKFAQRLTRVARLKDPIAKNTLLAKRLANILSNHTFAPLFSDACLPGWAYQCLQQKKLWQTAAIPSQSNPHGTTHQDILPEKLPALTQWFTPNWVSSFLVDESYKNLSSLQGNKPPTFLDPACGAGHILVCALETLVRAKSLSNSQNICDHLSDVLCNQLFGCDIDPYVLELAALGLYLKCRDLAGIIELPLPHLYHFGLHENPHTASIGSLWLGVDKIPPGVKIYSLDSEMPLLGSALCSSFSLIITNPPYLSQRIMPDHLSQFLTSNYCESRFDLYGAFISLCMRLLDKDGQMGLICQQSFMSVKRYQKLRAELLSQLTLSYLVQLGPGVFASRPGEKVNNAILIAGHKKESASTRQDTLCWRILSNKEKLQAEHEGIQSLPHKKVSQSSFATISGAPFSFWCPPEIASFFKVHPALENEATGIKLTNGLFTCDNNQFVKQHWQVSEKDKRQYVPYDKGGGHKWYRTTPYLLKWKEDGHEIRSFRERQGQSHRLPGEMFYFQSGITYSYIGTKGFRARLLSPNSIFDIASSALFSQHINLLYLLGFLNSSLVRFLLGVLNPTINFQIGDLRRLPLICPDRQTENAVVQATSCAVALAKEADTLHPDSPKYKGPAVLTYNTNLASRLDIERAYFQYVEHLRLLNKEEERCQQIIDEQIYSLYKVSSQSQKLINEDPWVTSGQKPLCLIPSLEDCQKELHCFLVGPNVNRWSHLRDGLSSKLNLSKLAKIIT